MIYKNKNIVAWCPICDQGWVEILKDTNTSSLLVVCHECESEWISPDKIQVETVLPYSTRTGPLTQANDNELEEKGWEKFVLKI